MVNNKDNHKKSLKHIIRIFLVGGAMGIANIIPGVSGGTIAVVFGIYEDLMEALGNFLTDKEKRWEYIKFLSSLFAGALLSIVIFAKIISWAYTNYELMTVYFFMGLILGSIPVVVKTHPDMKINYSRFFSFFIGASIVVLLALLQTSAEQSEVFDYTQISLATYLYFALCGAIASSAMIVPGISGSFVLILLGVYWTVLSSLSGLTDTLLTAGLTPEMRVRLTILGTLGIGIVIGILGFAKFMSWALKHYPAITMYAILGLIVGSFYQIYPGFEFTSNGIGAIITFIIGTLISLRFGKE